MLYDLSCIVGNILSCLGMHTVVWVHSVVCVHSSHAPIICCSFYFYLLFFLEFVMQLCHVDLLVENETVHTSQLVQWP